MHSTHNRLAAALLSLALLTGVTMDSAFARAPSSFQASCSQTTVVGNVLSSLCKTGGFLGGDHRSSLVLQGIYNDDGVLRDDGTNHPASFQKSCKDIKLQEYLTARGADLSKLPVVLLATCRKKNGAWVPANIEIRGINNEHGQLQYQPGGADERGGSSNQTWSPENENQVKAYIKSALDRHRGNVELAFADLRDQRQKPENYYNTNLAIAADYLRARWDVQMHGPQAEAAAVESYLILKKTGTAPKEGPGPVSPYSELQAKYMRQGIIDETNQMPVWQRVAWGIPVGPLPVGFWKALFDNARSHAG